MVTQTRLAAVGEMRSCQTLGIFQGQSHEDFLVDEL